MTEEEIDATYAEFRKRADEINARKECYDALYLAAEDARRQAHSLTDTVIDEVNQLAKSLESLSAAIADKAKVKLRKAWDDGDQYGKDLHAFEAEGEEG
jgi:hypothetical protein